MNWKLIIIIAVGAIMVLGVLEAIAFIADDPPNISGSRGIFLAFKVVTAFTIILLILGALYKFFPDLIMG